MREVIVVGVGAGAVYGLFALGLALVYKTTRVLNFAQAEIGTFTAYATFWAVVTQGLPWLVGGALGVGCAAMIGVGFERVFVRRLIDRPRLVLVVATAALALLLAGVELKVWGGSPKLLPSPFGGSGVSLAGVTLTPTRLVALGVTGTVALALTWMLRRTTFGLALLASAHDPVGVRLTGIRLRHLSAFTWGVSSALGGLAGILIALALGAFGPLFMSRVMLLAFAGAVLGGLASLPGALLGGVLVGIVEAAMQRQFGAVPGAAEATMFALLIVVLLVRPQGLLGRPGGRLSQEGAF